MSRLRAASAAVALAGLAVAAYLSIVRAQGSSPACAIAHGCDVVQRSSWAELGGVPVANLGFAGYAAILASLAGDGERARSATAFLAFVGAAFSGWLTYVEVGELHAVCTWCVASAA